MKCDCCGVPSESYHVVMLMVTHEENETTGTFTYCCSCYGFQEAYAEMAEQECNHGDEVSPEPSA